MKTIIVNEGQSIVDIAVQVSGSVEGVFDLLQANNLSLTAPLVPGQVLQVDVPIVNQGVIKYLESINTKINTGNESGDDSGVIGDYNKDFNKDFF